MICKGFTKCGERCKKTTNSKYCHLHRECAQRVQEKIRINIKEKDGKIPNKQSRLLIVKHERDFQNAANL